MNNAGNRQLRLNTDPLKGPFIMGIEPVNVPIHVVPVNDLKPHNHMQLYQCECGPRLEINNNVFIVVHQAYDGRE